MPTKVNVKTRYSIPKRGVVFAVIYWRSLIYISQDMACLHSSESKQGLLYAQVQRSLFVNIRCCISCKHRACVHTLLVNLAFIILCIQTRCHASMYKTVIKAFKWVIWHISRKPGAKHLNVNIFQLYYWYFAEGGQGPGWIGPGWKISSREKTQGGKDQGGKDQGRKDQGKKTWGEKIDKRQGEKYRSRIGHPSSPSGKFSRHSDQMFPKPYHYLKGSLFYFEVSAIGSVSLNPNS